jgi:hypothetical protein
MQILELQEEISRDIKALAAFRDNIIRLDS